MTGTNVARIHQPTKLAAIHPQSFEDVQRIARMAVVSGLFKADRKDDDNAKLAKATMAIMQGLEVGLQPMQAVQCIAIINGRALIYGDAVPALLWANGFKINQVVNGTGDGRTASCTITRPDGTEITRTFSVHDAKRARLWDERPTIKKQWDGNWEEKPNDSPWHRFADRMLAFRALGFAVKDGASDVTRGLYVNEEYEANEPISLTQTKPLKVTGPQIPDIPDVPEAEAPDDETVQARASIKDAINTEMLAHIRNVFPEADWETLAPEYDARFEALKAAE